MLLNNYWVKEEIEKGMKRYTEINRNEIQYTNVWGLQQAELREKFIPIKAYLKKQKKDQIKYLTLYLKE